MTNVVIASAARTPVGSFSGSFANTPAHDLGAAVLKEIVARAGIDPSEVNETILGQVLTAAQGQNPARQAHVNAGLPIESAAWSINQVCGSGLLRLDLQQNELEGDLQAFLTLSLARSLPLLQVLDLSFNFLRGNVPGDALAALTSLQELILDDNQLTSHLPSSSTFAALGSLKTLSLNRNLLTGSLAPLGAGARNTLNFFSPPTGALKTIPRNPGIDLEKTS